MSGSNRSPLQLRFLFSKLDVLLISLSTGIGASVVYSCLTPYSNFCAYLTLSSSTLNHSASRSGKNDHDALRHHTADLIKQGSSAMRMQCAIGHITRGSHWQVYVAAF